MIELYISGQSLRIYTPVIAADTLNYLTVQAYFLNDDWEGYTRWVHFRKGNSLGTEVFDLLLDGNNSITEDKGLNLSVGEWTVYLSGNREGSRLTTAPVIITVKESGLVDAPLHALPLSVAEQIANDAAAALACAREIKAAALAGDFDGKDGTSFVIEGFFDTPEALAEGVPSTVSGKTMGRYRAQRAAQAIPGQPSGRASMPTAISPGQTTGVCSIRPRRISAARPDKTAREGRRGPAPMTQRWTRVIRARRRPSIRRLRQCPIITPGTCPAARIQSSSRPIIWKTERLRRRSSLPAR